LRLIGLVLYGHVPPDAQTQLASAVVSICVRGLCRAVL